MVADKDMGLVALVDVVDQHFGDIALAAKVTLLRFGHEQNVVFVVLVVLGWVREHVFA